MGKKKNVHILYNEDPNVNPNTTTNISHKLNILEKSSKRTLSQNWLRNEIASAEHIYIFRPMSMTTPPHPFNSFKKLYLTRIGNQNILTSSGYLKVRRATQIRACLSNQLQLQCSFTSSQPQHLKHIKNISLIQDLLKTPSVLCCP